MSEATIHDRVRDLVVEAAPSEIGAVEGTMTLNGDLGYDSLSLLELLGLLENEFGLRSMDDDFLAVRTLDDVETMVTRVVQGQG